MQFHRKGSPQSPKFYNIHIEWFQKRAWPQQNLMWTTNYAHVRSRNATYITVSQKQLHSPESNHHAESGINIQTRRLYTPGGTSISPQKLKIRLQEIGASVL